MAGALVSQVNNYNDRSDGLPPDARARLALAQSASGLDNAAKGFGTWADPQYRFVFTTTTAADSASSTLNLATSIRNVIDPTASGSLQNTIQIGPLAGILTAGVIRPVRVRVKQFISNTVTHIFWFQATLLGGATPVVFQPALAALTQLGTRRAADDQVNLVAAAGSVVVNVVHGTTNVNITWSVDVFVDDAF